MSKKKGKEDSKTHPLYIEGPRALQNKAYFYKKKPLDKIALKLANI